MRRLFIALAAALMLLVPGRALALEDFGTGDVVEGQLTVHGPDLFYSLPLKVDEDDRKGVSIMRGTAAGTSSAGKLPGPGPDRSYFDTEMDASPSLFAVGTWEVRDDGEDFIDQGGSYLFAPLGGKLKTLTQCTGPASPDPQVAVDGRMVAVTPSSCGTDFGGVTLVDTSPAAVMRERHIPTEEDNTGELRLAGRYLAYVEDVEDTRTSAKRAITVYDWVTGVEVYRAKASKAVPIAGGRGIDYFDLQDDGTLVYASARVTPPLSSSFLKSPCADIYGVAVASVAEPVGHLVPGVKACLAEMRIGAGRVAFFRRAGARGMELVTAALDGSGVAPVASFGDLRMLRAFDFDGDRAGFAVTGCDDASVHAEAAVPAAPAVFSLPDCPVSIAARAGPVSRAGRTSVRVGCPAGCREVTLRAVKPFKAVLFDDRISAGSPRTVRFKLPAKVLARVRAGRTVRVRMVASTKAFLTPLPAKRKTFSQIVTVGGG
jgi:hypothetical protein